MVYIIISKGLSITVARKQTKNPLILVDKYAFRKRWFKTKREAIKYFNNLDYYYQRNQKIVKMWRSK